MTTNPTWEVVGRVPAGEAVPFTHTGTLALRPGRTRYPIVGGTFLLTGVAAMLGTAPMGADVWIDVNVNGSSIYADQDSRPRFVPGATLAAVGVHTQTTVTDGDYLSVDIDEIGVTVPGADLVVTIRLQRVP